MKLNLNNFNEVAELVKSNKTYDIYDLKLEHLVVSTTTLHPGKETRGHSHEDVEEIYLCLSGEGKIQVGKEKTDFKKDDLVTIPLGDFHKVFNTGTKELVFLVVFEKYERK